MKELLKNLLVFRILNFQMNFLLTLPRVWFAPCLGDGDWIYLAGGRGGDRRDRNEFEKINVVNGEVIQLKEVRRPCYDCHLIKF